MFLNGCANTNPRNHSIFELHKSINYEVIYFNVTLFITTQYAIYEKNILLKFVIWINSLEIIQIILLLFSLEFFHHSIQHSKKHLSLKMYNSCLQIIKLFDE